MRYYELLLEVYDRASTVRKFGSEIAQAAKNDNSIDHTAIAQYDDAQLANWILEQIEQKDPTQKNYCEWLARMYRQGQVKLEQINRDNLLYVHARGKQRGIITDPQHININNFKTYAAFEDMIRTYNIEEILGKNPKKLDRGKADKVYEDNQIRIIVPYDETAACYYGQTTKWCTAATKSENRFDEYNKDGPLYIIFIKKPSYPKEKYQMHLTGSGINARIELKNEEDQNVNIDLILREYPSIKTYFLSKFPEHVLQLFPFLSDNDILTVYNYTVKSLIKSITEFNIPNFNVNQMKKLRNNLKATEDTVSDIREFYYDEFYDEDDSTLEAAVVIESFIGNTLTHYLDWNWLSKLNVYEHAKNAITLFAKKYSGM